jgi:hypothetical protein
MPHLSFSFSISHYRRFIRSFLPKAAFACALSLLAACGFGNASAAEEREHHRHAAAESASSTGEGALVQDLPLANGGSQRVLYLPSTTRMRGVMVMFPGGTGEIGINKDREVKHGDNFVVRTHDSWQARGYGVVLVDALDHQSMRGARSSQAYADVTHKILAFARERANVPVWVLGTSQGSIAAMNAAAHADPHEIAGVVLTEPVSIPGGSHETVFDAHPDKVRAPALVVANEDDQCKAAPPGKANEIAQSMRETYAVVLIVQGGVQRSKNECGSLTPHGYYGIEDPVIGSIAAWMEKR